MGKKEVYTPCPIPPDTEVECSGCSIPCVPVECDVCEGTGLVTNDDERFNDDEDD